MRNGGAFNKVRFLSILEMEDDVLQQIGLIAFDGEVIIRLPVLNQIGGERALRQQCIGSDLFALDIDGIQQGSGHLDLVGLFGFIITFYRQGADFFWV